MAILETKDLRKIYGSGENEVHALDGVSISVEEGEFVAVIGTSGSGKSTLLNMIGGLDLPTSGSVTIRGKELLKMKDEELTIFRRRNIGFVFQNYNLLPVLNVCSFAHKMQKICAQNAKRRGIRFVRNPRLFCILLRNASQPAGMKMYFNEGLNGIYRAFFHDVFPLSRGILLIIVLGHAAHFLYEIADIVRATR